mgnify:CR=1 FL=1
MRKIRITLSVLALFAVFSASSVKAQEDARLMRFPDINNDLIVITTLDPEYSGEFLVTVTGPSSFDYTVDIIPTLPTSIGTAKKELTTGQFRFANNKKFYLKT